MEPLISSILKFGIALSMALILASLGLHQWGAKVNAGFGPNLQAESIPLLISMDVKQYALPGFWTRFLLHLGVSVLLLIPYSRSLISFIYFAFVERSWKHAAFTAVVLIIITIGLLTDLL